ncbi:carboxymuconolactone decarboxylase family protein [Novosphingobium mangrovi (ex Huang et al. 2023)]|uniref:Carboxymuconolactone decarboxylase family protein n=1 Tax=Novosphingobium mangrovi (ex Huang et al. 2023) TaxID=2976432 RepID=A0ABT2I4J7_9SPHN|nr:carboxymuconolactone decarboxylase family protein [Novosphingobium mangrovi (ex Huang et al. 2023)]MCT2399725.1 carboxymuconolactone decarboxylase family protein [Novosphingobium mangrovi (ex Huang et al. 2023)]
MGWDAAERTEQVVGSRERLPFLDKDQLDQRHFEAMEQLRVLYGYPEGMPLAPFFATLAHSPEFFAGYIDLGVTASIRSALPARVRELAILRTGWLHGAPYIWGEHVHSSRDRVLSREDIERITQGSQAGGWDELDRAVLRAAEELHANSMIGDETWNLLASHLDARQLLELPIVVGHYVMTAYVQNSLRTRLTDNNPDGLETR